METFFKQHDRVRRYEKPFSKDMEELFRDCYECWECEMNGWDCFHHCMGGDFPEADSVLNAVPLHNFKCHIGTGHHFTEEQKKKYLNKTFNYLAGIGYQLTDKDKSFINKFKKYYL